MAQDDWVEQGSDASLWNEPVGRGWDSGIVDKCGWSFESLRVKQDHNRTHCLTLLPMYYPSLTATLSSHCPTLPLLYSPPTDPYPHWRTLPTVCTLLLWHVSCSYCRSQPLITLNPSFHWPQLPAPSSHWPPSSLWPAPNCMYPLLTDALLPLPPPPTVWTPFPLTPLLPLIHFTC